LYDAWSPDVSPTAGRKAKGKRQKPKGKSSRRNIEVEIASALQTFYFCLLPLAFAFCLAAQPPGWLFARRFVTYLLPAAHCFAWGMWIVHLKSEPETRDKPCKVTI
jgi:hypothetical protein